jgi:hypothetical protein
VQVKKVLQAGRVRTGCQWGDGEKLFCLCKEKKNKKNNYNQKTKVDTIGKGKKTDMREKE